MYERKFANQNREGDKRENSISHADHFILYVQIKGIIIERVEIVKRGRKKQLYIHTQPAALTS
jgi:hypothetical protein